MSDESSPFTTDHAGQAFLVSPPGEGEGPGVLLLHSWWGLNDWTRDFARRIAAEGYSVLVPDLLDGQNPTTEAEAQAALAGVSPDDLSGLVMSSAHTVRAASNDRDAKIAVIGLSMGASMALWLSARLPDSVGPVVVFYGAQSIDFDESNAIFQGHFAEDDHMVSEEDRVVTESFLRLGENDTEFHLYPDTKHWFFETGDTFDEAAAELAWERTKGFLAKHLPTEG